MLDIRVFTAADEQLALGLVASTTNWNKVVKIELKKALR